MLMTGSHDHTLRIWKLLPSANLMRLLKNRLREMERDRALQRLRQVKEPRVFITWERGWDSP
jgi:hypothetical protein